MVYFSKCWLSKALVFLGQVQLNGFILHSFNARKWSAFKKAFEAVYVQANYEVTVLELQSFQKAHNKKLSEFTCRFLRWKTHHSECYPVNYLQFAFKCKLHSCASHTILTRSSYYTHLEARRSDFFHSAVASAVLCISWWK